ncbi:hypothetical protein V5O48_000217 [Marasmius crinis-equi]|uniref:Uncharacterized protein n=1 Tax=Marasmius crinis-equi TaxID=585013 RepID=A0ABR3G302_9AGAR
MPDKDRTLVLDVVLGLLAGSYAGVNSFGSELIEQSLDYLKEYGFSRFKAQVKAIKSSDCLDRKQCATHDLPISQRSLTPVECSPGVIFVKLEHIIPHLIALDYRGSGVVKLLSYPHHSHRHVQWGPEMPLLHLVRQPSPSLLLLLEPVVPYILNPWGRSKVRTSLRFVQWLKFLLPDPEYHSKAVSFMQRVRDWTNRTRSHYRHPSELEDYKETLRILDEAGVGNVDEFGDELGTEHAYQQGS